MDPAAPAVVAPPAAAGGAAAAAVNAARRPAGRWWQPDVSWGALTRAQLVMAAAAAAFALFASTLKPADVPYVPAQCATTAAETMELRYYAGLLLRCAIAPPPSMLSGCLACFANLLGLDTLAHLLEVIPRVVAATGGSCSTAGLFHTAEYHFHAILANTLLFVIPLLWILGRPVAV